MKKLTLAAAVAALLPLTACGSSAPAEAKDQTLTVFAASSLKATFNELKASFEKDHPGVTIRFQFGGSSDLVGQIKAGNPADVFASADTKNMDKLKGSTAEPVDFASNVLEIAVAPGNPKHITGLADLSRVTLVDCAVPVPCGSATEKLTAALGVTLKPASQEQSVTDVLAKVTSGQADAGIVYVTDVKAAGAKVTGVPIKGTEKATNTYEIAQLNASTHGDLARLWVLYVSGPFGRDALLKAGFGAP
jgi:molybdate transport system substrate-binding protein